MQLTRAGFFGLPPIVQAALMMTGGAACVALQNSMIRIVSVEIHTFEIVERRRFLLARAGVERIAALTAGEHQGRGDREMCERHFHGRAPAFFWRSSLRRLQF
jgi:hypothetical protein